MRGATIALQQTAPRGGGGGGAPTRLNLVGAAFAAKYVGQTKARRRHKSSARVPAMAEMGETLVAAEAAHLSWSRRWCMRLFCRPRLRGETRRQWANMVLESSRLATYIDALQVRHATCPPSSAARWVVARVPARARVAPGLAVAVVGRACGALGACVA